MTPTEIRKRFTGRFYLSEAVGFGLGVPLATLYALTLEPELIGSAIYFILIITAAIVLLVAYPMNFFLARKRGRFLEDFYEGKLEAREVEEGFLKMIKLPIRQSLFIFARIGTGLIIVLAYLYLYLKASLLNILSTFVFAFFGIYVAALVNYLVVFFIIDRPLKDIINAGYIQAETLKDKKHFGISFKSRTAMFLLIPVLIGYINILFLSLFYLSESSLALFKSRLVQMIIINFVSLLLGFLLVFFTEKRVINNLMRSIDILAGSEGGLIYKIPSTLEDEFGYISYRINTVFGNFSHLIKRLKKIAGQNKDLAVNLNTNSTQVSATVEEITATMGSFQEEAQTLAGEITQSDSAVTEIKDFIDRVNKRIEDQAASVAESSASVEETLASINNITRIAQDKKGTIDDLTRLAKVGSSNMNEMMMSIEDISKYADTILEMMEVINGVAKETNLLAMNAAIEAAHAGEFGKGFAVVADEIRKLSEATRENAKSISSSLTGIMNNIEKTTKGSRETESSISQIIEGISEVADSMTEMVTGMQEISSGSSQVMESLTNLVSVTEDVRQSSREMDNRARKIEKSIKQVSRLSEKTSADIAEIGAGVKQINSSMEMLAELGTKNSENLWAFEAEISSFKTEEEVPAGELAAAEMAIGITLPEAPAAPVSREKALEPEEEKEPKLLVVKPEP